MASDLHGIINWLKGWFYDKAEVDNLIAQSGGAIVDDALDGTSTNPVQNKVILTALNNKASSTHTHDGWESKTCGIGSLYVNTDLKLAQWNYNASTNIPSANTERNLGSFSSTYAPPSNIYQTAHTTNPARFVIHTDGKIGVISTSSGTSTLSATIMWRY